MAEGAQAVKSLFELFKSGGDFGSVAEEKLAGQLRQSAAEFRRTFSNATVAVDKLLERGNQVAFRYTRNGTDLKTNKPAKWTGSAVARVVNGKIVDIQLKEDYWGRLIDLEVIPTIPQDDISGHWTGNLFGMPFSLDLSQAPNSIKVTGSLSVPTLNLTVPVSGTNSVAANPDVQLSGSTGAQALTLTGNWAGKNQINGVLNGAGFNNLPVEINR